MYCSKKVKEFFSNRSKSLFFMIGLFITLNMMDLFTAMFILPGEANPIWLLFKSKSLLVLLKIFVCVLVVFVFYYNKQSTRVWYFSYVYTLVAGSFLISLGVASNIIGILNPQVMVTAATVTVEQKMNQYFIFVGIMFFVPYILAMLSFKLYDVSEKFVEYKKK